MRAEQQDSSRSDKADRTSQTRFRSSSFACEDPPQGVTGGPFFAKWPTGGTRAGAGRTTAACAPLVRRSEGKQPELNRSPQILSPARRIDLLPPPARVMNAMTATRGQGKAK